MALDLYIKVALRINLPANKLQSGDVAVIVEVHPRSPDLERGYSLEVFDALGDTHAVVTVRESAVKLLEHNEVLCVRRLDEATIN